LPLIIIGMLTIVPVPPEEGLQEMKISLLEGWLERTKDTLTVWGQLEALASVMVTVAL